MDPYPAIVESWSSAEGAARVHAGTMAGAGALRRHVLARTFADEVLPRLAARRGAAPAGPAAVDARAVERLLALALDGTQDQALAHVLSLQDAGMPAETILLHVLAPVARRLGRMWEDDTCSFSDVTIGVGRLSHAMRALGGQDGPAAAGSALLVQMPGEQHGFGLAMVAHFFRQDGWRVRLEPSVTSAGLAGMVRREPFDVVGISAACSGLLDALAQEIRAIRACSRNPGIGVLVGGPAFLAQPQLASLVGADATATDGAQAVREARRLAGLQAHA